MHNRLDTSVKEYIRRHITICLSFGQALMTLSEQSIEGVGQTVNCQPSQKDIKLLSDILRE